MVNLNFRFVSLQEFPQVDRSNFDCKNESVNKFIKDAAEDFSQARYSSVFLMLSENEDDKLVGYYTLSNSEIPLSEIPSRYKRNNKLPNTKLPAILIGQFGLHKDYQGIIIDSQRNEKLSSFLLADCYRRIILLYESQISAFHAIKVDTQENDSKAQYFWQKQGFKSFKKQTNSFFLPVQVIINTVKQTVLV